MFEYFQAMTAAIEAGSSATVTLWINWMMVIFLSSVLFAWKHPAARYALIVIFLTIPAAVVLYTLSGKIHLIGLAHIILWTPLFYYLLTREIRGSNFNLRTPFGVWAVLLTATIFISLVFDVRDTLRVLIEYLESA
ncbi:MAG: hypothetical protein EP340_03965 [Alphaproteobacteria bacterium]|nr:MAG: hypothetical protein EP340_03965 [Alphaproteobacteria bacterium]